MGYVQQNSKKEVGCSVIWEEGNLYARVRGLALTAEKWGSKDTLYNLEQGMV